MLSRRHFSKKRSGIGAVLATAIFVFIVIFMIGNLLVWGITQYANFQSTLNQMSQRDQNQTSEKTSVTNAIFGNANKYTLTPAVVTNTGTSGYLPITNMNFSTSTQGWTFTKVLPAGVSLGISGGYDAGGTETGGVGSASGPGLVFVGVSLFPSGSPKFTGTWSYRFFLDLSQFCPVGSTVNGHLCANGDTINAFGGSAKMSWGFFLAEWNNLQSPTTASLLISNGATTLTALSSGYSGADSTWNVVNSIPVSGAVGYTNAFFGSIGSPVWITVSAQIVFTVAASSSFSEDRILFDDIGIKFLFPSNSFIGQGANNYVCMDFLLNGGENTNLIQQLTVSVATAYSISKNIQQYIYLKNFATGVFNLVSTAVVSQTTTNITSIVQSTNVQDYIGVPGSSGCPGTTTCSASIYSCVEIKLVATYPTTFSSNTLKASVQDFYSDTHHTSIFVSNQAAFTSHIVDIWITNSTGHFCYSGTASNGCATWSGTYVAAGVSGAITLASAGQGHGQVTIKVVTDLGNAATLQVNA